MLLLKINNTEKKNAPATLTEKRAMKREDSKITLQQCVDFSIVY